MRVILGVIELICPFKDEIKALLAHGTGLGQTTYKYSNKSYVARYCGPKVPKRSLS
jgi:hypothetical protein